MSRKAELTDKSKAFCYNHAYLSESLARSYIHAGYKAKTNIRQEAEKLLRKPYVINEINRLKAKKAYEIAKAQAEKTADLIITRERQTQELERIKEYCLGPDILKDITNAVACIREQDKIWGLVIDVGVSGGDAMAEIDEARRAAAAAVPDEYFLNTPKLPIVADNAVRGVTGDMVIRPLLASPMQKVEAKGDIGRGEGSSSIVEPKDGIKSTQ